jgi:hypothetical protein
MSPHIVWIDQEHAKVFCLENRAPAADERGPRIVRSRHPDHHTHRPDAIDHQNRSHQIFNDTARLLDEASAVLLVGPGLAKHLFNGYLAEHYPRTFRKVVGCEPMDHPTDAQIRAFGKRFFDART